MTSSLTQRTVTVQDSIPVSDYRTMSASEPRLSGVRWRGDFHFISPIKLSHDCICAGAHKSIQKSTLVMDLLLAAAYGIFKISWHVHADWLVVRDTYLLPYDRHCLPDGKYMEMWLEAERMRKHANDLISYKSKLCSGNIHIILFLRNKTLYSLYEWHNILMW